MNVSDALDYRNMTKYSLAQKTGLSYSTVCDLANGKVDIEKCYAGTVRKIAKALRIPMEALFSPRKFRWVNDTVVVDRGINTVLASMMDRAEEFDIYENWEEYIAESEQIDIFCKNLVSAGLISHSQWDTICARYPDPDDTCEQSEV